MHTDWAISYNAAMREQEAAKLESLVETARGAIHRRILELGSDATDVREQHALDEALRQITLRRYRRLEDGQKVGRRSGLVDELGDPRFRR